MLKIQPLSIQDSHSKKETIAELPFSRKGLWLIGEEGWNRRDYFGLRAVLGILLRALEHSSAALALHYGIRTRNL